jgi:hypothetical protein
MKCSSLPEKEKNEKIVAFDQNGTEWHKHRLGTPQQIQERQV